MGVKGLHSYVESRLRAAHHTLALVQLSAVAASDVVVVDGMALIRKLYSPDLDWVRGGQFQELFISVQTFVETFAACGLRLVVFFDGGVDEAKLGEWLNRRKADLAKVEKVMAALERGEMPSRSWWIPPRDISKQIGGAFAAAGCPVFFTAGEADREMARYCRDARCAAVLGKDSDFFVLPVPVYLVLDSLCLRGKDSTVTAYARGAVLGLLGLSEGQLPLLASLVGNDFVEPRLLQPLHSRLLRGTGHAPTGAPLIDAVAAEVQRASASAEWRGPMPITPLLWEAIDPSASLCAEARARVDGSLEQYALDTPHTPLAHGVNPPHASRTSADASRVHDAARANDDGVRTAATAALDVAADVSTDTAATTAASVTANPAAATVVPVAAAAHATAAPAAAAAALVAGVGQLPSPSAELLRRFRTGALDSAIFTAATRRAIWRGPGIEMPDAPVPSIVATQPIRAEVYALCVPANRLSRANAHAAGACARLAAGVGEGPDVGAGAECSTVAGAAPHHSTDMSAAESATSNTVIVREHVLYASKPQLDVPDEVAVPPRLFSCEAVWRRDACGRCEALLTSLERASEGDGLLRALSAAACVRLGPVALVAFTLRFLRLRRLLPPHVAGALLCQGLVMAQLSRRRERLPPDVRCGSTHAHSGAKSASAAPSPLAVHAAALYLRTAGDILLLNSACGSPMALAGAWEWYDGPLFHLMYASADEGADGEALLRGDAELLPLLDLLMPIALATEHKHGADSHAMHEAAASAWDKAAAAWTRTHRPP